MLIDTREDDALEETLHYAYGAEHLPATPGDGPGCYHTKHSRAAGGYEEHHLGAKATAQKTARTQGEYVAPVEAGQDVRFVSFVPVVFLQEGRVRSAWVVRLLSMIAYRKIGIR